MRGAPFCADKGLDQRREHDTTPPAASMYKDHPRVRGEHTR
ncbi:hypothetical protein [Acrocarpospora pleiomorpha]|nr:hypothetical protein [Acrocarpospora pleiomorpha]